GLRGLADPFGRNELLAVPVPAVENQQAEPCQVLRVNPQTAAPARSAAHRFDGFPSDFDGRSLAVAMPFPFGRGSDRVHDVLAQNLRQSSAEYACQRKGQPVDTHVVVFVVSSRIANRAGLSFRFTELLMAQEIRVLAPHLALPFAFLLEV